MRHVLASLILVAGLAGSAQAQTPAPAAPAAPAAPTPAAAPETAAPAAPAPAPEAPPPPPPLPTSGDSAQILDAIQKVCMPAVRGQGIDAAAKAAGLKQNRREGTWIMPLASGRDYQVIFQPQFSQTNVCHAEVHYALGQDKAIVSAINLWSYVHKPELVLQANYVATDADGVKRVRKSWEHVEPNGASVAINFTVERKPDDTPLNGRFDTGQLFYQERAGS